MKKIAAALMAIVALASCQNPTQKYTDWLQKYMPLPDRIQYDRAYWEQNVQKTLEVREKMAWDIPEREFRHFVLPLRVNNETLDDFRTLYADTLCARVQGMSLADAALEINHWCHEQASYQPSDGRTGSPEDIILRGVGRCGEESVLAVAALRAAGIPARQVYTPRWAHTDDNHAWVEVYTGDGWHFMGACEPEPVLDRAWFNGSVSRAMILHTKVFGDYKGPEDVIQRTPCYTEINVVRNYVPTRRTTVTVTQDGAPAKDANVSFRIYNYAEFYNVVTYKADSKGQAALDMGLGDMFVLAWKGDRFGYG
ncbi:MAG: transglutaminase domain-containing protein, partial [Bacteroidales bacterium]|nr:transglutaminase domain-containing protein [Bacteroidales bacterium]